MALQGLYTQKEREYAQTDKVPYRPGRTSNCMVSGT